MDVGYHNYRVFGVAEDNTIWYRQGITTDTPYGTNWFHLPQGSATDITVCDHTGNTWMVGTDDGAYFAAQNYYFDRPNDNWIKQNGGDVKQMDCGANGIVWLITNSDSIYIRTGVTRALPEGMAW